MVNSDEVNKGSSTNKEIWKAIPGYEGKYEASNLGKIRSVPRVILCGKSRLPRQQPGKVLSPSDHGVALYVTLCSDSKWKSRSGQTNVSISRLVLFTFVGPCPDGMECCHNDGDYKNNVVTNLRWDTPQANIRDRDAHGTTHKGSQVRGAKLTDDIVRSILIAVRDKNSRGLRRRLAEKHRVSPASISAITKRHTWKHITI